MLDNVYSTAVDALLNGDFDRFTALAEVAGKGAEAKALIAQQAEAKIVQDALGTPEGRRFLDWLIGKTLLRGPNEAQLTATTAEAHSIANARREGQNQLVATIIDALKFARGETKEMPDAS